MNIFVAYFFINAAVIENYVVLISVEFKIIIFSYLDKNLFLNSYLLFHWNQI